MQIKAAELARMYCTNRALISRATTSGKLIRDEMGLYDFENKKNKKFLHRLYLQNQKKIDKAGGLPHLEDEYKNKSNAAPGTNGVDLPDDFDINNYSSTMLINKFGTALARHIVELEKNRADALKKTQEHKMKAGELIERETVAVQLFHYLEILNKKLLSHPEQVADRMIAVMKSKGKNKKNKVVELMGSYITRSISDTKKEMKKRFKQIQKEQIMKHAGEGEE